MLTKKVSLFLLVILGLLLGACAPAAPSATLVPLTNTTAPTAAPVSPSATAAATYTDPFTYCAAVGTLDAPDARYTGPKVADNLIAALRKALNSPSDMPQALFQTGVFWRCLKGTVYACFVGANLPCESKANVERTPSVAENDFCKANPDSAFIPAAVTGHDTIFEWTCKGGTAQVSKQVFQVDERGYISEIWYALQP